MRNNSLYIIIGGTIALFAFLTLAYKMTSKPVVKFFAHTKEVKSSDHTKWSASKKHVVTEYSDLQCPTCKAYHETLKQMESDPAMKPVMENITFVYRHFPLDSLHANAREAAYASEAAAKQNKFYAMSDKLFDNQETWAAAGNPDELFKTYAKDLKLDMDKFNKDYASSEVKEKVQADFLSGSEADVQGTPTFYLDGNKLDNVNSFDEFKTLLLETAKK
jgi:protein-disulfide isomerase